MSKNKEEKRLKDKAEKELKKETKIKRQELNLWINYLNQKK